MHLPSRASLGVSKNIWCRGELLGSTRERIAVQGSFDYVSSFASE
jgi:hypothetical protein